MSWTGIIKLKTGSGAKKSEGGVLRSVKNLFSRKIRTIKNGGNSEIPE